MLVSPFVCKLLNWDLPKYQSHPFFLLLNQVTLLSIRLIILPYRILIFTNNLRILRISLSTDLSCISSLPLSSCLHSGFIGVKDKPFFSLISQEVPGADEFSLQTPPSLMDVGPSFLLSCSSLYLSPPAPIFPLFCSFPGLTALIDVYVPGHPPCLISGNRTKHLYLQNIW